MNIFSRKQTYLGQLGETWGKKDKEKSRDLGGGGGKVSVYLSFYTSRSNEPVSWLDALFLYRYLSVSLLSRRT